MIFRHYFRRDHEEMRGIENGKKNHL